MSDKTYKTILGERVKRFIVLLLLCLGVAIRICNYLKDQSFWLDESYVAFQIVNRSWSHILRFIPILPDQPQSPLFFICINKVNVALFGNHEMALRLFPLTAGVLSLILFYFYTKKHFSRFVQMIAMMYMSFSGYLIYYSVELKPYSSDVLATLLLLWVFDLMRRNNYNKRYHLLFGMTALVSLWLSNATLFVYPPLALVVFVILIKRFNKREMIVCLAVNLAWVKNFFMLHEKVLQNMVTNDYILDMYRGFHAFPSSYDWGEVSAWFLKSTLNMLGDPVGFGHPVLAASLFVLGCYLLFRQDKTLLYVFISPIVLLIIMAIAQKYPYWRRLILFISPVVYMIISVGLGHFFSRKNKIYSVIGLILFFLISGHFFALFWQKAVQTRIKTENRQSLVHLKNHIQPEDVILLNQSAQYPFMYYLNSLDIVSQIQQVHEPNPHGAFYLNNIIRMNDHLSSRKGQTFMWGRHEYYIFGYDGYLKKAIHRSEDEELYQFNRNSIRFFKGRRVWLYLSHYRPDVKDFLLSIFNANAKCVQSYDGEEAAVFLYSFESAGDEET
ncbi:MAG: glycosyltransferase family 39 protein [Candidatus Omnitrophica bacterium]|nr:glycosyltransferase family 39 protein [Candidatus Omnitrophota bacterium]